MKLLFDQNLSWRLPLHLVDIFPESLHVGELAMTESTDTEIWEFAKLNNHVIVSKDKDFQQRSLLLGHPPKVVRLRVGNCPVHLIEEIIRKYSVVIHTFELDKTKSFLALP
ncbi:MAG: DUF5615 family PIN-like protein [Pyrinomonadaceae bacterium]